MNIDAMLEDYAAGMTVKQVGAKHDMSTGKTFYLLRDAGCLFRPTGLPVGTKRSKEFCEMQSKRQRSKMSDESKRKISEANSSTYNGLNGWGHTKPHNKGYVRAYAPLHPRAAQDGYVMLHTVVVENAMGKYLADNECVHHINHIRDDNRLENLKVMIKFDHRSMHMKERINERRRLLLTV